MNTIELAPLLLIFAEVAKVPSFTKAAKKLGISKSAVRQQIKRLEPDLELQLLARNTRGVLLTPAGETLLSRSALLSEQLANAVQDINQTKAQASGPFKVSIPPFFERNILVPALTQLCLEFPLIEPELVITGRWQDLIEHQLEASIFGGGLKNSNYKAQSIGKVQDIFCASPTYLEQAGTPQTINQLNDHKYISSPWKAGKIHYIDDKQQRQGELILTHVSHTNTVATLVDMTVAGFGISLLPKFIANAEKTKEIYDKYYQNIMVGSGTFICYIVIRRINLPMWHDFIT